MREEAGKPRYPYIFYGGNVPLSPLFAGLKGDPYILEMSPESTLFDGVDPRDQVRYQRIIEEEMGGHYSWGIASYLEDRRGLLSSCPQMQREGRFFHLGLDIIAGPGTALHAPIDAVVEERGYEEGEGNYGGYVLLRHSSPRFQTFYSLYGHLELASLPTEGRSFKTGEVFARIGDFNENGNWFYHTHLQVITRQGYEEGFVLKGYCAAGDLPVIGNLCPSPLMLFTV
jgi:hypothetical protein